MRTFVLMLCGCCLSAIAAAQVVLPPLRLPLPQTGLPLPGSVETPAVDVPLRGVALRLQRVRELLRTQRREVEADAAGNPIVRGEVLVVDPSEATLAAAGAAGLTVQRQATLEPLGMRLVVLRGQASALRSLAAVRTADPAGDYELNHIYLTAGEAAAPAAAPGAIPHDTAQGNAMGRPDGTQARVGLIDSGVDPSHEVFRGVPLDRHGCDRPHPDAHGTATASLLVGNSAALRGAAPAAHLFAADVYCAAPAGGAVYAVAEAFAWMAQQQVPVINVSLVGPANGVLANIVQRMIARGHLIVAAVGNDGPAAAPLYPAAWPGVVAVTAVDERRHVLLEAGRGPQVMFAAPGAHLAAARPAGGYALVRGTSFAAPLVAGLLALHLGSPDRAASASALDTLTREALHIGAPGRDPVYGYGLVGESLRLQPALAALHAD